MGPFVADKMACLFEKIKRGRYTTPAYVTQEAADLLSKMLKVDVDDRITIRQIREHSWFRKDLPAYLDYAMDYAEHGTPNIATLRLRQSLAKARSISRQYSPCESEITQDEADDDSSKPKSVVDVGRFRVIS